MNDAEEKMRIATIMMTHTILEIPERLLIFAIKVSFRRILSLFPSRTL